LRITAGPGGVFPVAAIFAAEAASILAITSSIRLRRRSSDRCAQQGSGSKVRTSSAGIRVPGD
jgi:hypothetical protein